MTKNLYYLRIKTLEPDRIYMAIVNNGEIIWSHQHTMEFTKMIDIGKKLVKIIVEHNTSRFIGRLRGTEIWNNARLRIYPNHLSNELKYREKPCNIITLHFVCDEYI